jgi:hypothetical protein
MHHRTISGGRLIVVGRAGIIAPLARPFLEQALHRKDHPVKVTAVEQLQRAVLM